MADEQPTEQQKKTDAEKDAAWAKAQADIARHDAEFDKEARGWQVMGRVHLDWPDGMREDIAADLVERLGLDEGAAEQAADIVATHLVSAISDGVLEVSRRG